MSKREATRYFYLRDSPKAQVAALRKKRFLKLLSMLLLVSGVALISYVALPVLQWQLFYAPSLSSGNILSPIPKAVMVKSDSLGSVLADVTRLIPIGFDSTQASQWFPTGNPKNTLSKEYTLSIPKLGIENAKVIVGADDLSKSLIHYGGASLPGEYGNAVVFGHSILPQFFNPKNYKAIFSTLHTLKPGDEVRVTYDGITYKYVIFDFSVVAPSEISVLEQAFDSTYLTLITCTPPGTYWKRLVVKAKIEKV